MKILIDARLYGPEHTGNGRYTMNLVENLAKIDHDNEYIVLFRRDKINKVKLPQNFKKVEADFRHYTFTEQFKLPFIIWKIKPDIVHFPHFNVPLLYLGKYVVTIHDLIMHKFKGGTATVRPVPLYHIWRIGYYLAFAKAIYGSSKIVVPSYAVKTEVKDHYHINGDKIIVTYE